LPIGGSATIGVIRGNTARSVIANADFRAVEDFAATEPSTWPRSELAERILAAITRAPLMRGERVIAFRGRPASEPVVGWQEMGPHPAPPAGRYNRAKVPVLYLCLTEDGVRRERAGALCIQEYELNPQSLRIADFSHEANANLLHVAFDVAERVEFDERPQRTNEDFPRFLADLAFSAELDGFLVPGVRGEKDRYYHNVVLFNPIHRWESWSRKEAGFRRDT
jgi:hypothetical protein